MKRCPICGDNNWDEGRIELGSLPQKVTWDKDIFYNSWKKKFLRGRAPLFADACLSCGHVEIYIDYRRLSKTINK